MNYIKNQYIKRIEYYYLIKYKKYMNYSSFFIAFLICKEFSTRSKNLERF